MQSQLFTNLNLKHITLYKNNLGFFERTAEILSSSENSPQFSLSVLPDTKNLVIDTLSVSAPNSVTTNFDTEKHQLYVDSITPDDTFKFAVSKSLNQFLESCIGTKLEIIIRVNSNII